MTQDDLHLLLTSTFDLVIDPIEHGDGRSYFWQKVMWAPAATTRILRVQSDTASNVTRVRLCISSDNNNSVFIPMPLERQKIHELVAREIALYTGRPC